MTEQEAFMMLQNWFSDDGWGVDASAEHLLVRTGINGEHGKFRLYAHIQGDNLVVHSVSPTHIPAKGRGAVAEYLTRANYGLVLGNFEMDWNDGEVRYKTSFRWKDAGLNPQTIHGLVYVNCAMMDRYYPGLMSVLYGGATPEQAIRNVENWS